MKTDEKWIVAAGTFGVVGLALSGFHISPLVGIVTHAGGLVCAVAALATLRAAS